MLQPTPLIPCTLANLRARCRERGYGLEEVQECIARREGDLIWVDVSHPKYPKEPRRGGPGSQLKGLLARIGIVASPACSCSKRARIMDEKGCDWCEQNIDTIDGWLAEEAKKRKLPYLSMAGKALIRLAIRRARKKDNG